MIGCLRNDISRFYDEVFISQVLQASILCSSFFAACLLPAMPATTAKAVAKKKVNRNKAKRLIRLHAFAQQPDVKEIIRRAKLAERERCTGEFNKWREQADRKENKIRMLQAKVDTVKEAYGELGEKLADCKLDLRRAGREILSLKAHSQSLTEDAVKKNKRLENMTLWRAWLRRNASDDFWEQAFEHATTRPETSTYCSG